MNQWWSQYENWFAARTQREKVILAVCLLFLAVYPLYWFGIVPALNSASTLNTQAVTQRSSAAQLQAQVAALQSLAKDPDAVAKATLADLQKQIAAQEPRFKAVSATVVPADKVAALLERLLANNNALQLISLKSLPPKSLVERTATGGPLDSNVYLHGVEIKLTGSYADLLGYLEELEHSPQRVLWSRLTLDASDYRHVVMTLTVSTLSLDKAWLAL